METPHVYMIAGPNGAGKTSAAMTLLPNYLKLDEFVNADKIARGLSPIKPENAAFEAGKLTINRINHLIENKKDFAFETTASGHIHRRTLEKCKEHGYKVNIIFIYLLAPELAIKRVHNRVTQGGHNVPNNDIIRRYNNGLDKFIKYYLPLADYLEIYDNSYSSLELVAKGKKDDLIIHMDDVWKKITGDNYERK